MARKRASDYIQGFRFQVLEPTGTLLKSTAGFKTASLPSKSAGTAEFRDGLTLYTKKQPGIPTVDQATFNQGVTTTTSEFWKWGKAAIEGDDVYRADLIVDVFDSSNKNPPTVVKQVSLFEAWPSRVKPVGDLDATNSDILLRELQCELEDFDEVT